jgi:glycosyltransferase involved in cell wall biosynthesis
VAAGHDVVLAAHADSTSAGRLVPVLHRAVGGTGDLDDEVGFTQAAWRRLAPESPDVVHEHTAGGAGIASTVPRVTTMHGPSDERLAPIYRQIARRSAMVAISGSQAGLATGVPVAQVIHHGVDPTAFPVRAGDGGYLLHLGRMSPTKGIDRAIRVARRAGMPLVITSKMREPEEREYFDQVIRPMLGHGVTFHGESHGREKLDLLGDAVALLNPIRWPEPFGMVMIEAMACGTPVVVTPCGAAPEIVEHDRTGFVVADEAAMVAAVGRLGGIDRQACRRRVVRHFSTTRMVEAHLELYRRLVGPATDQDHHRPHSTVDVREPKGTSAVA